MIVRCFLVAAPLVLVACSGAQTRSDGGPSGGASATGATGGVIEARGGASGTSAGGGGSGGGSGGTASNCKPGVGGSGGTIGRRTCAEQTSSVCNVDAGIQAPPQGACGVENAACRGHICANDNKIDEFEQDWASLCCGGQWVAIRPDALTSVNSPPACPTPIRPGDSFPCGDGGLTCVAGQAYCAAVFDRKTSTTRYTCEPLCSAGDCSCFCQPVAGVGGCSVSCQQGGCPFEATDQTCSDDSCSCGPWRDALGVRQPGAVVLNCTRYVRPQVGCTRDDDCPCNDSGNRRFAYACVGAGPPAGDCVTSSVTGGGPICGLAKQYYCCSE